MALCERCRNELPATAALCPRCGAPVGAIALPPPAPAAVARTPQAVPPARPVPSAAMPPAAVPPPAVPTRPQGASNGLGALLGGRYRATELVGEGAMGHVYRAKHAALEGFVCLKVLRPEVAADPVAMARFEQEARSASRLRHPNVIQIHDFGRLPDGTYFLAMEFVNGRTLAADIAKGPLSEARACHVAAQILSALDAAHRADVVHRDLKPENVMLEQVGDDPDFVKVLDFGIATLAGVGSGRTSAGMAVGTPAYMSPEQAAGVRIDHRADLYSVGVLLYRMVCGALPFDAATPLEMMRQHATATPVPPRQRRPPAACSPELEALILKALSKPPGMRPQSAEAFRRDLLAIGERSRSVGRPGLSSQAASTVMTLGSTSSGQLSGPLHLQAPAPSSAQPEVVREVPAPSARPDGNPNFTPEQQLKFERQVAKARFWRKNRRRFQFGASMLVLGVLLIAGRLALPRPVRERIGQASREFVAFARMGVEGLYAKPPPPPPPPPPEPEPVVAAPPVEAPPPEPPKVVRRRIPTLDPRCPPGMVYVPSTLFPFGATEAKKTLVSVKPLCIDQQPARQELETGEPSMKSLVVSSAELAAAKCKARGRRLCNEEEWVLACRGPEDDPYPYGGGFLAGACSEGSGAACASGFGAHEMVGARPEWTAAANAWARDPSDQDQRPRRKGGAGASGRCSHTVGVGPEGPAAFRCCASPK